MEVETIKHPGLPTWTSDQKIEQTLVYTYAFYTEKGWAPMA